MMAEPLMWHPAFSDPYPESVPEDRLTLAGEHKAIKGSPKVAALTDSYPLASLSIWVFI